MNSASADGGRAILELKRRIAGCAVKISGPDGQGKKYHEKRVHTSKPI